MACKPLENFEKVQIRLFGNDRDLSGNKTAIVAAGLCVYRDADKSLARSGRKQATATEDFEFHISYL
jgi:5,10-methenyltetrahydromethanopterin hydrogenase